MKKYFGAEDIELVFSGKNYFEILDQLISQATEILQVQTYIFESDETGLKVVNSIKKAALRGVKIFLLMDAYGSFPFKKEIAREFAELGIYFRFYSPLFSSESIFFGRRLHHKIIVADRKNAMIGGINIANKYNFNGSEEAWLDYAVLVRGRVCEYLDLLCSETYNKKKRSKLVAWENKVFKDPSFDHRRLIRFRRNDFIKQKNEIYHSYMESMARAESSIVIVASYFLPGYQFRRSLRQAAARGVKIRIILAGVSDVPSVKLAQNYLYEFYLSNNIELYEWQNSVLHGKAMMVDNTWVTIGSYNLNFLSHYISIELNADIIDKNFIRSFSSHIDHILSTSCTIVQLDKYKKNTSVLRRFKMNLAYIFHRTIMNMVMMGRKHRRKKR